jgi:predicted nucleotidyltransferase
MEPFCVIVVARCIFFANRELWGSKKWVNILQNKRYLLEQLIKGQQEIELAVLVGSQAQGTANDNSDWDIALRWLPEIEPMQRLGKTETLRRLLASKLKLSEDKVDLIDLTNARLAMRSVVAEEGIVLKGEDTLAWNHFLLRTWRDLESFYWDKIYATRTLPN